MRLLSAALLVAAAAAAGAAVAAERPEETTAEFQAARAVVTAIEHRNCELAVQRLNEGLAQRYPSVLLMAGTMYEEGLCLKPNWDRARQLYQRAVEAGHEGGRLRLIAGLAPAAREPGTAIWWAQQSRQVPLPGDCRVPEWVHADAEAYVATLKAWPAGRLAACAYVAGVMASVAGDAEYPTAMVRLGVAGKVQMAFVPAEGRVSWRTADIELKQLPGWNSGEMMADRSARSVQEGLRRHLESMSDRALQRYPRPADIDPTWRLNAEYVFRIE